MTNSHLVPTALSHFNNANSARLPYRPATHLCPQRPLGEPPHAAVGQGAVDDLPDGAAGVVVRHVCEDLRVVFPLQPPPGRDVWVIWRMESQLNTKKEKRIGKNSTWWARTERKNRPSNTSFSIPLPFLASFVCVSPRHISKQNGKAEPVQHCFQSGRSEPHPRLWMSVCHSSMREA